MRENAVKIGVALGVASAIKCVTSYVAATLFKRDYHSIVNEFPLVRSSYPSLALEVSQLGLLEQDLKFRSILATLQTIVELDEEGLQGNEFKIARLLKKLHCELVDIVRHTEVWKSQDLLKERRIAEEDTIPSVEGMAEAILHNFILRQ